MASKYNEALLGPIVAGSTTLTEVMRKLGLKPTGGNHRYVSARVRHLRLDTSHFQGRIAKRIAALTTEELEPLVAASKSVAHVLALLGLPEAGGSQRSMKRRLQDLAIDTTHFRGQGWSRGETGKSHPSVERGVRKRTRPDSEVFVENAPPTNGRSLGEAPARARCRLRLRDSAASTSGRASGSSCTWITSTASTTTTASRTFACLCPNCHSQTDTYGRRASHAREEHVLYDMHSRAWRNWYPRRL